MQSLFDKIEEKMAEGQTAETLSLIEEAMAGEAAADKARLLYLRGRLYMKLEDWQQAMNSFMQAEAIDGNGPAAEARQMLSGILDFYNKDLYNP